MVLPRRNEKDLPEVPEEVKRKLTFHFVRNVDEVLQFALAQRRVGSPARAPKAEPT